MNGWLRFCAAVVAAGALWGCSSGGSPQAACDRASAYQRRCSVDSGVAECELQNQRNQCVLQAQNIRGDFLAAASNCYSDSVPCGEPGQQQITTCVRNSTASLTLTGAQRSMIQALCERCPQASGNSMADVAACVTALSSPSDGGTDMGIGIVAISDDAANRITSCLNGVAPNPPSTCSNIQTCIQMLFPPQDAGNACM